MRWFNRSIGGNQLNFFYGLHFAPCFVSITPDSRKPFKRSPAHKAGFFVACYFLSFVLIARPSGCVLFGACMYRCRRFDLRELVPQEEYRLMGYKAWWLLDTRLLLALDQLRTEFGLMVVNTWHSERLAASYGLRSQAGFRNRHHYKSAEAHLGSHSQHKYGRAADCLFGDVSVDEVRQQILGHPDKYPLIMAVEENTSWLHIDVRNCEPVLTF